MIEMTGYSRAHTHMPDTLSSLRVEHLAVSFGRQEVLHDISLGPLPAGTTTALLGPNGSGKSTLLRALAGLLPARGAIWLGEHGLDRMASRERARFCAYLPQTLPPTVAMEVLEAVMVARQAGGARVDTATALAESLALLDRLGIGELALRQMNALSGGQRQLVGLAQALVRRPQVLLLDEPLSALDLHHQVAVMDFVQGETRRRGLVTVIVLHDLNVALQHADHAVVLCEGRLLGEGPSLAIVTPDMLRKAYDVRARIEQCSRGRPCVIVDGIV
ncbi:iron ABC transporter ATP-binding protein [Tanticharoenia sakaeratensis NBRC 103193]|nr:iron ABC transporter ATP-binding protein [Tanticharoenia sakaeratensis NBRC 103193]